jgi:hypothetical protein
MVLVQKEIKRVTIRPNGTEKQIRPAIPIPTWNLIAYYPLTSDAKDYSWNWNNLTQVWTITYWQTWAETSNAVNNYLYNNNILNIPTGSTSRTYVFWSYLQDLGYPVVFGSQSTWKAFMLNIRANTIWQLTTRRNDGSQLTRQADWWKFHVMTFNGSTWTWYVNTSQLWNWTIGTNTTQNFWIFNNTWNTRNQANSFKVWYVAIYNKILTTQEMSDYYNQTKWNYWL